MWFKTLLSINAVQEKVCLTYIITNKRNNHRGKCDRKVVPVKTDPFVRRPARISLLRFKGVLTRWLNGVATVLMPNESVEVILQGRPP